jgi:very-short-patch-repair endonuclease
MTGVTPGPAAEAARIARSQESMITWAQLRAAGVSRHAIAACVANGWLVRRHRSVYQLGVACGRYGDEMAALLACGPHAALGYWTGAWVVELCERAGRPIHVVTIRGLAGRRAGIRAHRTSSLPDCDVVTLHGLRVTTPARTLLDLAATASHRALERLAEEAQVRRLASPAELHAVIARNPGRPGVARLRAVVESLEEPQVTRSEAEQRLRELVRGAGLPTPRMNVRRAGWEVDAVWDGPRLVVEVDGYRSHSPKPQFERDRRKDADLMLAGYRVLRITWKRLTSESMQVATLLATALSR